MNLRLVPAAVCTAVAVLGLPITCPHLAAGVASGIELCRLELKPGNAFTRVGPPAMPDHSRMVANAVTPALSITYTGFSAQAQAAFNYAASLVETQMRSRIQFKVSARMEALSSAGVLGFASTSVLSPGNWTPADGGVPPPHLQNRDTRDPVVFPQHFVVTLKLGRGRRVLHPRHDAVCQRTPHDRLADYRRLQSRRRRGQPFLQC